MFNLTNVEVNRLCNNKIICLSETWILSNDFQWPSFLDNFNKIYTNATKVKSRGRGSGGLVIFCDKNIQTTVLNKTNNWIFIKVRVNSSESIIIGLVYFNKNFEILLDEFQFYLNSIPVLSKVIIGGDFNCRIGSLNQLEHSMLENSFLRNDREVLDKNINPQGRILTDILEEHGFVVLNGRTISDFPGQYTFVNKNGKSTPDLIWANFTALPVIHDMLVANFIHLSDHFLCILKTNIDYLPEKHTPSHQRKDKSRISNLFWNDLNQGIFKHSLEHSPKIYCCSESPDCLYENIVDAITEAASASNMYRSYPSVPKKINSFKQPWYNSKISTLKITVKNNLKECKRSNFNSNSLENYIYSKTNYKKELRLAKKEFNLTIQEKLANIRNSAEFWKTISHFRNKKTNINTIDINKWTDYFNSIYTSRSLSSFLFFGPSYEYLDQDISLHELQISIAYCKNNKAPGSDNITNEFYKNITPNWEHYIQNLFNKILKYETVPRKWSEIILTLIHKKGDQNNPENYRGIALVNTLCKIFTQILLSRLNTLLDEIPVIPECQSGFRKSRGCIDNIFSLTALIHLNIMKKGKYLYAIFVDMKRAFDSVSHSHLWQKLYSVGISSKFINIIKSLYTHANIRAKINKEFTTDFPIDEGVLQGETLSPVLFSLFMYDIEDFFRSRYVKGVKIDENEDVLLLCYADDIVIFATSEWDVQEKLNILADYCSENKLTVNTSKTKILPFHRSNNTIKFRRFKYIRDDIEVVNKYTYLGVEFSSNGKFLDATNYNISKGKIAAANIKSVLAKSKSDSWVTKKALLESTVKATLLYASEVWSLRYLTKIETVQLQFIKSLFFWPKNTPNFVVRFETAVDSLEATVIQRALRLLLKLNNMEDHRIPKKCLKALKARDFTTINNSDFNWVSQLRRLLTEFDCATILDETLNNRVISKAMENIIVKNREKDIKRCKLSNFSEIYKHIATMEPEYLKNRINFSKTRVFSQLRVAGTKYISIYHRSIGYKIKCDEICTICNMGVLENIHHFLLVCPLYNSLRQNYLREWLSTELSNQDRIVQILCSSDVKQMNNVFYYIMGALKIRSFCLNE